MRIALDATYSLGGALSGVGVYSREILYGLARSQPQVRWDWFYRSQRFVAALRNPKPADVTPRFLAEKWGSRAADLFHGLNQRLPHRRFRRQIATFHDLFVLTAEYSTAEFRERFAAQAREAASASDLVIAVSQFTASQVEELLGVPGRRIRVISHGVTPRAIPSLPRENVILSVGAIQRRKNQSLLVRAFRSAPKGWRLVLAGSQGFGAEETLREIRESPRAADIEVIGYLSDEEIARWYARASLFVFPSLDEGFGMPVLEAMAAGLPVISSGRSALREVCGDAALLIDPENEEELAAALTALIENNDRREEFIQRGFSRAAGFTWQAAVDSTFSVYRELLS